MQAPTNCFHCEKVFDAASDRTPYRGTVFYSTGNYGSTVFDPMRGGVSLSINICDDCLTGRAFLVEYVTTETRHETAVMPWTPGMN